MSEETCPELWHRCKHESSHQLLWLSPNQTTTAGQDLVMEGAWWENHGKTLRSPLELLNNIKHHRVWWWRQCLQKLCRFMAAGCVGSLPLSRCESASSWPDERPRPWKWIQQLNTAWQEKHSSRKKEENVVHKHQCPAITAPWARWDCCGRRRSTHNASAWLPLPNRVMSRWLQGTGKPKERWLKVNWIEWILLISVRYTQQERARASKWTYLTGTCNAPVIEPQLQIPAS